MKISIWVTLLTTFLISGCRWVDDFREMKQPIYLEQPQEPTLNRDSPEYVGVHKKTYAERKAELCNPDPNMRRCQPPLPAIDNLSKIPEVPDHPAGADN